MNLSGTVWSPGVRDELVSLTGIPHRTADIPADMHDPPGVRCAAEVAVETDEPFEPVERQTTLLGQLTERLVAEATQLLLQLHQIADEFHGSHHQCIV